MAGEEPFRESEFAAKTATASPITPDVTVSAGALMGEAREFVFENDSRISELTWPIGPTPAVNLDAGVTLFKRVRLGARACFGVPGDFGTVTDSDYLNEPTSSAKTHYSEHDGRLDYAVHLECAASFNFTVPLDYAKKGDALTLVPSLGFQYKRYKWTASDGWAQYPPESSAPYTEWSESGAKTYFSGSVMTYEQIYLIPFAGIGTTIPISDRFSFLATLKASPYLWCNAKDEHLLRDLTFYDYTRGGWFFESEITGRCAITRILAAVATVTYTTTGVQRGDTYQYAGSSTSASVYRESDGEGGGTSLESLAVRLGLEFKAN